MTKSGGNCRKQDRALRKKLSESCLRACSTYQRARVTAAAAARAKNGGEQHHHHTSKKLQPGAAFQSTHTHTYLPPFSVSTCQSFSFVSVSSSVSSSFASLAEEEKEEDAAKQEEEPARVYMREREFHSEPSKSPERNLRRTCVRKRANHRGTAPPPTALGKDTRFRETIA